MTVDHAPLLVERLGNEGDGIAVGSDGRPVYVPFALPGETASQSGLLQTNSDRVAPACKHFETCGGCVAQHMGPQLYASWKHGIVQSGFRQHGLDPAIEPLITVSSASRRRASLSIVLTPRLKLGFHLRRSTEVFDLDSCPVLTSRIVTALPGLKSIVARLSGTGPDTRITVADLAGGLDVCIDGARASQRPDQRSHLAALSAQHGIARLTIGRETIIEHEKVRLRAGPSEVQIPPGAFFQAVAEAEAAIVAAVLAALPKKAKRAADLFAGVGTLSLPLAQQVRVFSADNDKASLDALAEAVRRTTGLKPVETRLRDLFSEPLSPKEMENFDAVILDPPRAGAKAQSETLARSKVPTVILVSCNPASLGRDVRILIDGGYKLGRVTPIDQFLWSNHVEIVAVLQR
jgi:23S rRNA (uracil1939-C5)-methyltransferase